MEHLTEAELLRAVIASALLEVHTCQPGRVESYDADQQVADVQPEVRPGGEELPVVPHVPVLWSRGGDGYLHFPLGRGDTGLLVACEVDIGAWRSRGQAGDPGDDRRHSLAFSVFLPGLVPASEALDTAAGATVLAGSDVRLGAADASEKVLCGDAFKTAMATWKTALGVWATAVSVAIPLGSDVSAQTATFATASTNLINAIGNALSSSVKVED